MHAHTIMRTIWLGYPSATLNTHYNRSYYIYPLVASFVSMYLFADDHDCVHVPPEEQSQECVIVVVMVIMDLHDEF